MWKCFQRNMGAYVIKHEFWRMEPEGTPVLIKSAYSPEGIYLGGTRWAYRIVKKYGITKFFLTRKNPDASTASVGYSPKRGKWYGWSHRAIYGFKKGQLKKKGCMPNESRQYVVADPRRAAESFAAEVS